ncbi:MAG: YfhD family protein [Candidatus Pristimantibacillus lignocellulolyticus]|uniref:YfhD family protein n=1 Tax=Candidatus Pristimantibacillus lignocellulolyticus TaxID=2994561 RepID=A0A9J6ZDG4_9BACL|nr:MAG: YfhD family protein [Candidatus Pristimantibacillus lignocellulolyticus]
MELCKCEVIILNKDNEQKKAIPSSKNEDVEFAIDQADQNDLEALKRAEAADQRQESK